MNHVAKAGARFLVIAFAVYLVFLVTATVDPLLFIALGLGWVLADER